MKIGYIGHGCYIVSYKEINILIDPLLTDKFQCDLAAVQPRRHVNFDQLPKIDAVLISHAHQGHLEIESLNYISRDTPIFYSNDNTIKYVLNKMGFTKIYAVSSSKVIKFGDDLELEVTSTKKIFKLTGFFFHSKEGNFWYMGDRGDTIDKKELFRILNKYKTVEFLVPSHPSDENKFLFSFNFNSGAEDETQQTWLSRSIQTIATIKPKLFAPNTVGMKFIDKRISWLNQILFPMSPSDFINYYKQVDPNTKATNLNPGDVITIKSKTPIINKKTLKFVKLENETYETYFDPTFEIPKIKDPNLLDFSETELKERINDFFLINFYNWVLEESKIQGSNITIFKNEQIPYNPIIVYPSGHEECWKIVFDEETLICSKENRSTISSSPFFSNRIPATVLIKWSLSEIPNYFAWNFTRPYRVAYSTVMFKSKRTLSKATPCDDLLFSYFASRKNNFLYRYYDKTINGLNPKNGD